MAEVAQIFSNLVKVTVRIRRITNVNSHVVCVVSHDPLVCAPLR